LENDERYTFFEDKEISRCAGVISRDRRQREMQKERVLMLMLERAKKGPTVCLLLPRSPDFVIFSIILSVFGTKPHKCFCHTAAGV
jgi:hypothetical protein